MPTEMKNLKIDKVDLVDKGAQGDFVSVRLYKRDDSAHDHTSKSNELLSGDREVDKAQRSNGGEPMTTPLSDEVLKALPDEVQKAIADLVDENEALKKGAEEEETPLSKRDDLPEDVRKRFEEQESRIAKAEALAAAERDMRVRKEWTDKVDTLTNLPDIEVAKGETKASLSERLFDISKTDEDLADSIFSTLKALNEQVGSDALFAEIGKRGSAGENTAEGRLESVVKRYVAEDGLTEPEAWAKALQTNADDYEAYLAEKQEG